MDKCAGHIRMPKEQAIANLISKCTMTPVTETVPLTMAVGRVVAEDVNSILCLPNMNSSRMDGIAVYYKDFADGMPDTSGWKEGKEYRFCNCGIGIPGEYDTVIKIEEVNFDEENRIVISSVPSEKGEWMTPPGTTVNIGESLVKKNEVLTPFLISRLAMGGYGEVNVIKKPVVAVILTGNELVPAGEPVPSGMNVDSNSLMMRAKIDVWGGEPLIYPICKDDMNGITDNLKDALAKADIVIINAGSSQGRADFTVEALNSVGTVLSHIITSGPGAHTSCTVANNGKPIVGIPGPAVGAECTVDWFIKPLMDTFLGQPLQDIRVMAKYIGEEMPYTAPSNGFSRVQRAMISRLPDGSLTVRPVEFNNGREMNLSNGFISTTSEGIKTGTITEVQLRWPYRFI